MEKFARKLKEIGFVESMQDCFDAVPMPKMKCEKIKEVRREAVWACLNERMDKDQKLAEEFANAALDLAKEVLLDRLSVDYELDYGQPAPSTGKIIGGILDMLFDDKEEN